MGNIITVGFDDLHSVIQDAVNATTADMDLITEKFKAVVHKDPRNTFPESATASDFLVGVVVNVMTDVAREQGKVLMMLPGEDRTNLDGVVLMGRVAKAVLQFGERGAMDQFLDMAANMLEATPKDQLRKFLRKQGGADG